MAISLANALAAGYQNSVEHFITTGGGGSTIREYLASHRGGFDNSITDRTLAAIQNRTFDAMDVASETSGGATPRITAIPINPSLDQANRFEYKVIVTTRREGYISPRGSQAGRQSDAEYATLFIPSDERLSMDELSDIVAGMIRRISRRDSSAQLRRILEQMTDESGLHIDPGEMDIDLRTLWRAY